MPSVKKNFAYSSVLTLSSFIFPLIVFPYVSRVLGVANIGLCNFVDSIISYFCMFSMMGMSISGIREIATAKGDNVKLSQTFSSLVTLSGITTAIAAALLFVSIHVVPQFHENSRLMYIGLMKLVFNFFLIEWFYQGMENFKFITIRSLIIKVLYVVSVFVFVRRQEDYWVYYLLTVISIVVNSIVNMVYSRKLVSFSFKNITFRPYLSGFFIMGVYLLVTSLYTTFNTAYLGMVSTNVEVGYYTTADKLYMIIIAFYTAFTGVMMPRMTSLLSEGKIEEFKKYINNSVEVLFTVAIPIIIISCVFSREIIWILSGEGYEGAIVPMQIMMPLILIIGYEQVLIVQTLMPMKKDKIIFRNSVIGGIIGVTLNFLIVRQMGAIGSSIVWFVCEMVVMVLAQVYVQKLIGLKFPFKDLLTNILVNIPFFAICYYIHTRGLNSFVSLAISGAVLAVYFVLVQLLFFKESIVSKTFKRMLQRCDVPSQNK